MVIYGINYALVFIRKEMGKKFGSKERNRDWTSGLPVDSPLLGFGTVKTVPGL